jgi:hypothetical protein
MVDVIYQNNLTWTCYTLCVQVCLAIVQKMVIFDILHHVINLYSGISEAVGRNIFLQVFEQTFATRNKTPKMIINWTERVILKEQFANSKYNNHI